MSLKIAQEPALSLGEWSQPDSETTEAMLKGASISIRSSASISIRISCPIYFGHNLVQCISLTFQYLLVFAIQLIYSLLCRK